MALTPSGEDAITELQAEVDRLSTLVLAINDALFGVAGVLSRAIVDADVVTRLQLADALESRAGSPDVDDHNRLLLAFARAIRMNFPGGGFDVIEGGKTS